jgi:hypothetical protein
MPMNGAKPAPTPAAYGAALAGWQGRYVQALRAAVVGAAPQLVETVKWGHLVYVSNGPVLLIRAEDHRVLFGFWRGKDLRHVEPRLRPGGKYAMATLELLEGTPLAQSTVVRLVQEAVALNLSAGDPTDLRPGAVRHAESHNADVGAVDPAGIRTS